ncbi:hypothetical protein, partial [Microbulbifer epialgicus]
EVHGLTFKNIETVDAGSDNGVVDKLTTATQVDLTGTDKELINTGITFQNLDSVVFTSSITGIIAGSALSDTFVIDSGSQVTANEIVFTGFNSTIDAGSGLEDSVSGADGSQWFISDIDNQIKSSDITFLGIESVIATGGLLTDIGTSANQFTIADNGSIDADAMTFTGFTSITGSGDEILNASAVIDGLSLTGSNNQVIARTSTNAITVSGIAAAQADRLTGSNVAYEVTANNALTAQAIDFTGLTEVVDSGTSGDVASTASDQWTLTDKDDEVVHAGISFQGIKTLSGGNNILAGHDNNGLTSDTYTLRSGGDIQVDAMVFVGMDTVNATGNLDAVEDTGALTLTGNNAFNVVDGSSIIHFTGIDSVTGTGVITGTSGDDIFTVTGNNTLLSKDISFEDVSSVLAGGQGSDGDTV